MPPLNYRFDIKDKFFKKVMKSRACWFWIGATNRAGYGIMSAGGRSSKDGYFLAHRVSYKIHNGTIPDNMLVIHKCDNPSCVNPEHLRLGTQADNLKDMAAKNRSCIGEKNARSKLTNKQAIEIYKLYTQDRNSSYRNRHGKYLLKDLAKIFNISITAVQLIVTKKKWSKITSRE